MKYLLDLNKIMLFVLSSFSYTENQIRWWQILSLQAMYIWTIFPRNNSETIIESLQA